MLQTVAHCYCIGNSVLFVPMAAFMLLLLLASLCAVSTADDQDGSCPLWHYRDHKKCIFGNSVFGAVLSHNDTIYLRVDYGMDVWYNTTVVAQSRYASYDYSTIPSDLRVYIPITLPDKLMCNGQSFMCGQCIDNHGPSAYSYKCHKCDLPLPSAIALYLTVKLLPAAVLLQLFASILPKGHCWGTLYSVRCT